MSYVFISYSREDSAFANLLVDMLQMQGFGVWIDRSNIEAGAEWQQNIENAIRNCTIFLVIMTSSSMDRQWVDKEIEWAKHYKRKILPVSIKGIVFDRLSNYQALNSDEASFNKKLIDFLVERGVQRTPQPQIVTVNTSLQSIATVAAVSTVIVMFLIVVVALSRSMDTPNSPGRTVPGSQPTTANLVLPTSIATVPTSTTEIILQASFQPIGQSAVQNSDIETSTEAPYSADVSITPRPSLLPRVTSTSLPLIAFNPTVAPARQPTSAVLSAPMQVLLPTPGNTSPAVAPTVGSLPTSMPVATLQPTKTPTTRPPPTVTPSPTLTKTPTPTATLSTGLTIQTISSFTAPGGNSNGITCDGSRLWVSDNSASIFSMNLTGGSLRVYTSPEATPEGLIWNGQMFFITTTSRSRVYSFQATQVEIITLSWFESPGSTVGGGNDDMAWDGTHIWYSEGFGIYKLDITGNVVDSFAVPKTIAGIAWDGANLWIAENGFPGAKLNKLDAQGQIIASYQTSVYWIDGLDWCNGSFWAVGTDQITMPSQVYQLR
ncbi:MAG: TIR domain-containing protein [Anaerolineae bacterium]|nr:TIR domain-containing protein [Anaerolineae bacterium]